MTETNMMLSNPYRGERRPGSVGVPLPGVEVRAVREDPQPTAESGGPKMPDPRSLLLQKSPDSSCLFPARYH